MKACKSCKLFDVCAKEYGETIGGDYNMPPCASNTLEIIEKLLESVTGFLEEIRSIATGVKHE